jgi:hypothetical protein
MLYIIIIFKVLAAIMQWSALREQSMGSGRAGWASYKWNP